MTENEVVTITPEKKSFANEIAKNGVGLIVGSVASLLAEKAFDLGMAYIRARKLK